MFSSYSNIFFTWLSIATLLMNFQFGNCQQLRGNVGPRNITRSEGDTNVYIPCPFFESVSPVWIINGHHYEVFNLPKNIIPLFSGLLITKVEISMDGQTFQCIGKQFEFLKSTVATLTVERPTTSTEHRIEDINLQISGANSSESIDLDHQRIVFERDFKSLSWTNGGDCNGYRLESTDCNGKEVRTWDRNIIQGTTIAVPSSFIVDTNNKSLYFKLKSVNRDTGATCQIYAPDIVIQMNDITELLSVPFQGFCRELNSSVAPYIVLPSKSAGSDCPCALFFRSQNDRYNLSKCSCGNTTIFVDALSVSLKSGQQTYYNVCLTNLTREMNDTIIHFYELKRECVNDLGNSIDRTYKTYFQSLKIFIVLPAPPDVMINGSGQIINFYSQHHEGIELDYYQVIIADVTNQTLFNITSFGNNVSVGDLFQQTICSPYSVTVEAHNIHGATKTVTSVEASSADHRDVCNCVKQNVNADIDLVNDVDSDISGLSIQVNCSHSYNQSLSNIYLNITVIHRGAIVNSSIILCEDESNTPLDFLKCNTVYELLVSWTTTLEESTGKSECLLSKVQNSKVTCSENTSSSFTLNIYIFIMIIGLMIVFVTVIIICFIVVGYLCCKLKKRKMHIVNQESARINRGATDKDSYTPI